MVTKQGRDVSQHELTLSFRKKSSARRWCDIPQSGHPCISQHWSLWPACRLMLVQQCLLLCQKRSGHSLRWRIHCTFRSLLGCSDIDEFRGNGCTERKEEVLDPHCTRAQRGVKITLSYSFQQRNDSQGSSSGTFWTFSALVQLLANRC